MQARAKDPAKRRALRGAVLKDIGSRAKAKLGRGVEKARAAGERAVGAVKSSSDTAQSGLRTAGSEVKKGAKGLLGGAARAVSRGARDVARRLGEDVDLYDVVLEHLLEEGYADTEEAATVIMANMSEEWREEILDEATIMSVTSSSGKKRKTTVKGESPDSLRSRKLSLGIKSMKDRQNQGNDREELLSARKKNIERLNAKPGEDDGDYDAGYHEDDDTSGGKRHYSLSRTNRDARRRRASGR
jgi:hypothetical protein